MCPYARVCTLAFVCACMCVHVCACAHACTQACTYECAHRHVHAPAGTLTAYVGTRRHAHARMQAHTEARMHACRNTGTHECTLAHGQAGTDSKAPAANTKAPATNIFFINYVVPDFLETVLHMHRMFSLTSTFSIYIYKHTVRDATQIDFPMASVKLTLFSDPHSPFPRNIMS